MYKLYVVGSIIVTLLFSGCVSVVPDGVLPSESHLIKNYKSYRATQITTPENDPDLFVEPKRVITLQDAISVTLIRNPLLKAFSWEVRAKEASVLQAGLFPNPVVSVEIEDFAGTGDISGFGSSQLTLQLSQLVPLAGKISKRKEIAINDKVLSEWDYEIARLDVLTEVTKSFIHVAASQKRLELIEELLRVAKDVYKTISVQVDEGEISPIEEKRAKVVLSQVEVKYESAKKEFEFAKRNLASMWGSKDPYFEKVYADLTSIIDVPSFSKLSELVSKNPYVARWSAEMARREATIQLEESKAVPDITISVGSRWLNETNDQGFVVGVSVPIQVFDRNQGNILEAHYRLLKAEEEKRDVLMKVNSTLAFLYKNLTSTYMEVNTLKNKILPSAENAFQLIFEGYKQGKFDFLDVLDSQRTLFDVRLQYISALADYHTTVAEIERLIAVPLEELNSTKLESSSR